MTKKNIITVALGALLLSTGFASCDLEREPKRDLSQNSALLTYTDAKAWEAGLLGRLRAAQGGIYTLAQDVQADELTATSEYGNAYGAFADWTQFYAAQYDTRDVYARMYTTIKNANFMIEKIPALSGLSATELAGVNVILGEAYFTRAYCYLELAKRYAKAYSATTAATDLCVPLLLKYDMAAKPSRATNQEVYTQILADLTLAETLLAGVAGSANASVLTVDAVKAVKARTQLYMADYSAAYTTANGLISSATYPLMAASSDNMKDMWQNDGAGLSESIFLPLVSFPSEANTGTNEYLMPNPAKTVFAPRYIPTKTIYDLYDVADTRKTVYFLTGETASLSGIDYTDLVLVNKLRGNPSLAATSHTTWGKVPDGRMRPKLLRIAEQYLIAAEAAYHNGGDALTPLNALRQSRGLSALATTVTGQALLQEIQNERQRELAFEGFRLFDLKRWGRDVVRNNPQTSTAGTPYIQSLAVVTYPSTDYHFVWPIPYQDVQTGGLVQNDGY